MHIQRRSVREGVHTLSDEAMPRERRAAQRIKIKWRCGQRKSEGEPKLNKVESLFNKLYGEITYLTKRCVDFAEKLARSQVLYTYIWMPDLFYNT